MRKWRHAIAVAMLVAAGAGVWGRANAQTVFQDCPNTIMDAETGLWGSLVSSWSDGINSFGEYVHFAADNDDDSIYGEDYFTFTVACGGVTSP